ncbi:hypothetical protein [Magnetospirillum sp. UT-4]|uniref:hypothetical protein n=1 Tax=Magnetospirillum sp. UT-4 TaxID=2681467 RepID=UPI001571F297|nr:hypothetical protein [Magnetospirillum sp. UT-4]
MPPFRKLALVACTTAALAGCVDANSIAKQLGQPPKAAVDIRSMQTRRFDSLDERAMLTAATEVLQDLGFTISESSAPVGVLTGAKQRDAEEAGQVALQVGLMILAALAGSSHNPMWDKEQSIQVTLVVTPVTNSKQLEARVSFDRKIWNNTGALWRAELLLEPEMYQQFFDKLSQSVFLEANKI